MTVSNLAETYTSYGSEPISLPSKENLQDKIGTGLDFTKIMVQRTTDSKSGTPDLTESIKTNQSENPVTNKSSETSTEAEKLYEKSQGRPEKVKSKQEDPTEEDLAALAEKLDTLVDEVRDVIRDQFHMTEEELDQLWKN